MKDISNFSTIIDPSTGNNSNSQNFQFDDNFQNSTVTPYLEVKTETGTNPIEFLSNAGLLVGRVNTPIPTTESNLITAIAESHAGIWQNFVIDVKVKHNKENEQNNIDQQIITLLSVGIDIETISDIVIIPQDIPIEMGESLSFDMQNFVVDGIGKVTFTDWNFNNTNTIPIGFTTDGRFLKSTGPLSTASTYDIKVNARSLQLESLSEEIKFKLIIFDPRSSNVQTRNAVLVETRVYTLPFDTSISTINGQKVINAITLNNVRINVAENKIELQALINSITDFTFEIITRDGSVFFIHVIQVKDEKDIIISAFEYSGQIFKTTDQTVQNYQIQGETGIRDPNVEYDLQNGATLKIKTDGNFNIIGSKTPLIIIVTTNIGRTITLNINGNNHKKRTIVESPPTEISLGSEAINVKINQENFTSSLDLGYAVFTIIRSSELRITNVKSNFQRTLLQYENIVNNKVQVSSLEIDINREENSQIFFEIFPNFAARYITPFTVGKFKYDDIIIDATGNEIPIFKRGTDDIIGSVRISGNAIDIISKEIEGITRPFELIGGQNDPSLYLYISISENFRLKSNVTPGDIIQADINDKYVSIGTLDNNEIVSNENLSLSGRAQIEGGSIVILISTIAGDFQFYGVTEKGKIKIFNIKYIHQTIYVSNIKQILIASFLAGDLGPLEFIETDITVNQNFVNNPNGKVVLHTIKPFYGRWTIETE